MEKEELKQQLKVQIIQFLNLTELTPEDIKYLEEPYQPKRITGHI